MRLQELSFLNNCRLRVSSALSLIIRFDNKLQLLFFVVLWDALTGNLLINNLELISISVIQFILYSIK
jgi:hypothetical protein